MFAGSVDMTGIEKPSIANFDRHEYVVQVLFMDPELSSTAEDWYFGNKDAYFSTSFIVGLHMEYSIPHISIQKGLCSIVWK
jgi:hypothetical protein